MWQEQDNTLTREFTFPDFMSALHFVDKVAVVAEEQQHHPDIELGWGRVKISLSTHDAGGVTEQDHVLAAAIDTIK